ncbi:MAG: hypothetical protein ACTSXT_09615 [Candidatus Helarchaeota archaeon]
MSTNENVRNEILKIMTKFGFWAIMKNYMNGVAGYIRAGNNKIYCEILFPNDYPNKNAIFKFPNKTSIKILNKYNELIQKNKKISPFQIIDELRSTVKTLPPPGVILEEDLDLELNRISKYYKISTSNDKYKIKVEFESPKLVFYSMDLDVHNYPKLIDIKFSNDLQKVIGDPHELEFMKNWNSSRPLDILEIIDSVNKILKSYKESITDDQTISIKNLDIIIDGKKIINNLNFLIQSGELIGIYTENQNIIKPFFNAFIGKQDFSGDIRIFEKSLNDKSLKIIFLDFTLADPLSIFNINPNITIKKLLDKIQLPEKDWELINKILSIIQLDTIKKSKIKELNLSQKYRLLIGISVIYTPDLILINKPEYQLNDTEQKRVWNVIKELNSTYFTTMVIYSETNYIKNCNAILIISKDGKILDYGTHDKLINILPTKEIIILQLNLLKNEDISAIRSIKGINFIIEERKGEKYRLFCNDDSRELVKELFKKFGNKIFRLSKEKPGLIDVIPYIKYIKNKKL